MLSAAVDRGSSRVRDIRRSIPGCQVSMDRVSPRCRLIQDVVIGMDDVVGGNHDVDATI